MNRTPHSKIRFERLLLIAGLLIAICGGLAYAGSTGTITGVVTDAQSGQPIPGAIVMIYKTSMGANVCPMFGTYTILNVPPGEYTLRASCIGYKVEYRDCIPVVADSSTTCSFALSLESILVGEGYRPCTIPQITKDVFPITRLHQPHLMALPHNSIDNVIKYLCD
jgi:hypothetical protein